MESKAQLSLENGFAVGENLFSDHTGNQVKECQL
jgi:hypothetical protein